MKTNELFPSNFLKSSDFKGKQVTLTIDDVRVEKVGQKDEKPVMYFRETKKAMVLNKTNCNAIASLHGEETDIWTGRKVTLTAGRVEFQGKMTDAIRVVLGNGAQAQTPQEAGDEIPF